MEVAHHPTVKAPGTGPFDVSRPKEAAPNQEQYPKRAGWDPRLHRLKLMAEGLRLWLWAAALLVLAIDAWVWLRFRPSRFTVQGSGLEVIWPLKCRHIPRESIVSARVVGRQELKKEIRWGLRVGAGGIWGGFGWLWTRRRGVVQMYISRTDVFVWIERVGGRPWLLTPEEPGEFVRALSQ